MLAANLDEIAGLDLVAASGLDIAIHHDIPFIDDCLGRSTAVDDALELQNFVELYGFVVDQYVFHGFP